MKAIFLNIILLLMMFISNLLNGQGFIKMDTIKNPTELIDLFPGIEFQTIQVDFNGDGLKDYICQPDNKNILTEPYTEIWINSDFKKVKSVEKYLMDYDFLWFVNIDNDPEPEIFSATGYSDGIDYCFIDQNLKTGKDSILFYFNPIILNDDNIFWGYPWDISDLLIKWDNGILKIKCALNHNIIREGEITIPDWQNQFPVICFSGKPTQSNINAGQINEFQWLTISEIMGKIKLLNKK